MVAFALAHLFYIIAFGFRGLAPIPFIVTFAMAAGALHTILPMLDGTYSYQVDRFRRLLKSRFVIYKTCLHLVLFVSLRFNGDLLAL